MLHAFGGRLEIRAAEGGAVVAGAFPYDTATQIMKGRYERIARGAFHPAENAFLLAQHDMDKPLASVAAGTLTIRNTDAALEFEARIPAEIAETSHGRDTLAMLRSGLITGLSPGFIVRDDAVERDGDNIMRTVRDAELIELSAVTMAAYPQAQIQARSWQAEPRIRFLTLAGPERPFWWYR